MNEIVKVSTPYGMVKLSELIRVYGLSKEANKRAMERRRLFNQSEEGKQLNAERSKDYYYRNREKVLLKAKLRRGTVTQNDQTAEPSEH